MKREEGEDAGELVRQGLGRVQVRAHEDVEGTLLRMRGEQRVPPRQRQHKVLRRAEDPLVEQA